MKITNCGRGIHKREVKGIEQLQRQLPSSWYAFTNLDITLGLGQAREIDVIVVSARQIFLVDLKDWHGEIESVDGRWHLNGIDKDPSPVRKITGIARDVSILLRDTLSGRADTKRKQVPNVEGLVVLTGKAGRSKIAPTEIAKVLTASEFVAKTATEKAQRQAFGNVAEQFVAEPLTDAFWKEVLTRFFNAGPQSPFRPGKRRFQRFVADESVDFAHRMDIYREYDAHEEGTEQNLGTLRLWDFTKCIDTRFQSEDARLEIAGREQRVYHWLRDRGDELDRVLLAPKIDETEQGAHYWQIFDRRRHLRRLSEYRQECSKLPLSSRVELARQLLSSVAALHRQDASHLDIGGHSVWLEAPTTVKLSHLLAARYPEVPSLGRFRYQFLSSSDLPEDVLGGDRGPKRRDVFLAAAAVHTILFGAPPSGDPPEWSDAVDPDRSVATLHDWFAEALEFDASVRFADADVALEAFNKATASRPTPDEVSKGLDGYRRGPIRSQTKLVSAYPMNAEIFKESDRVDVWRSSRDSDDVVVKLWKQAAWGDLRKEGARILAFLERASDLQAEGFPGLPQVREVLWLGDAIALVQDHVPGAPLDRCLIELPEQFRSADGALAMLETLVETVETLNGSSVSHGDLKPENVILRPDGGIVLIDILDFSPEADGEIQSSTYAPENGSAFERDRFAVTVMVEQILNAAELDADDRTEISAAAVGCRTKVPALTTLRPVAEAIGAAKARRSATSEPAAVRMVVNLSVPDATVGPLLPDEGFFHLRVFRNQNWGIVFLHVRGAFEEIEIRLDPKGRPAGAKRRELGQGRMSRVAVHEFRSVHMDVAVSGKDVLDLSGCMPLLEDQAVRERVEAALAGAAVPNAAATADPEAVLLSEEVQDDLLAEEIATAGPSVGPVDVDVPALWRALIDVEDEITTEGMAQLDSRYDRYTRRHNVAFELQSGSFEFSRTDTVGVLRQDRRGGWRRIGQLDLQASSSGMVVIEASDAANAFAAKLVEAGQRLRFVSHFEVQSFKRRKDAVDVILGGGKRAMSLLSVFDPRSLALPSRLAHEPDRKLIGSYGLNQDQRDALDTVLAARPVGLLQGPPGTGKTTFIAALTHYAISKGLARNVLVASQSHEAVHAAEAVLKLFRRFGTEPDILRIAVDQEVVSGPLRPFHSARLEQALKDRFQAEFKDRISIVGRSLGVDEDTISEVVTVETSVRQIADRLVELRAEPHEDNVRVKGLLDTLSSHLRRLGIAEDGLEEAEPLDLTDAIFERIAASKWRARGVSVASVGRLRAVASLGRDFVASASRSRRSMEPFLAGTRQIVTGTCVGLGRGALGLTSSTFDLVIVDEAARCMASEILVPLQAARWAVLVGDQAQLEPQHDPEVVTRVAQRTRVAKREVRRSDFERIFSTPYAIDAGARLRTQYRMLPAIGKLVSKTFYAGLDLKPGREVPEIGQGALPADLLQPLVWVGTDDLGSQAFEDRSDAGHSRRNRVEAEAILVLLEAWCRHEPFVDWLTGLREHPVGIGVICMYGAQRDFVYRKLLRSPIGHLLGAHIKVGTVDSYQGKENPIVLLSLVRNNDDGPEDAGEPTIRPGFLSTPNRINVAASRAKDRLVIVGSRKRWSRGSPVHRLSSEFAARIQEGDAVEISASDLLSPERRGSAGNPTPAKSPRRQGEKT